MRKRFSEKYFKGEGSGYIHGYEKTFPEIEARFNTIKSIINLKEGWKVLDIGCAFGYFLKLCDEIGCETYGIDVSPYAITQARNITKAKMYIQDVEKGLNMFPDNFFDLVTMFHVIEHFYSPYLTLNEVKRVMKIGGYLIIITPNLNALERFVMKTLGKEKRWHGFVDETHIYLFNPTSLKFLVERTGLYITNLESPFKFASKHKTIFYLLNKLGLGGEILLVAKKK